MVAVFGPTGTGKTALALELADRIPCRLISCDALQVYRNFDRATAKPQGDERRHPWALIDAFPPELDINLGEWVRAAERELEAAWGTGRLPVVVGGTGLYLRGLLKGVAEAPARDPAQRQRLLALADRRGVPFLHRILGRLDPPTARRLRPNDRQRIVRALEVRLATGHSLTRLQDRGWERPDRFRCLKVGLDLPRELLYERLDQRVDRFFAQGLVDEVRSLLHERGVPPAANAFRAIGYREVLAWLFEGEARPIEEVIAAVKQHTRNYAKRQLTWFRRESPAFWIDPRVEGGADALAAAVKKFLAEA